MPCMSSYAFIPLVDHRLGSISAPAPTTITVQPEHLVDTLGRTLGDLRISVTDRCNFRCTYCMPRAVFGSQHEFLPQDALLTFEEITRLAEIFVSLGVKKIRLTGGEPLLRKNLERLIEMLSRIRTPKDEQLDLTLTTNASLLAQKAKALKDAGLQRITISLDALDDEIFRRMNDADFPVASVLKGIDAAQQVGLTPIKVNMVVKRGVNDGQIIPMAKYFRGRGIALRFIEYMDVGNSNGWRMDQVLPSRDVLARLQTHFSLEPVETPRRAETAERWRHTDGMGEIGLISSVTQAFCGDCNRARLSTEGRLFLCLFASQGHDLRGLLRSGRSSSELAASIATIWQQRSDRYSELRGRVHANRPNTAHPPRVEMHYIGG